MTYSYAQALALVGAPVPRHLQAQADVPVLTGVQAQGDLLVLPCDELPAGLAWSVVPPEGVALITSEATGNTHWLHQDRGGTDVRWATPPPAEPDPDDEGWGPWAGTDPADLDELDARQLRLAFVDVPEGRVALLIHTDEHGANGIGPGRYAVHRKREADERYRQRLLAD